VCVRSSHTIKCTVCRKPFASVRSDARTCSPKCRKRAQRLSVTGNVTDIVPDEPLNLKPIAMDKAQEFVKQYHRHNHEVRFGQKYAISVVDSSGELWAVAIVSHPSAKGLNHGGYTGEVRRVCTRPGAPTNCCSKLYSACWRAWKAMGGTKMITYTLVGEPGTSLKAAGYKRVAKSKGHTPGTSWDTHPRRGKVAGTVTPQDKWRWEVSVQHCNRV
jgi:hypothetical protein